MGNKYQQLTIEERCEIARLCTAGHSQRQIAASLDRAPSTVARELMRNSSRTRGYQPSYAQQQARARRWSGSRLERDASLRQQVLAGLTQAWSPEQVAGRLALAAGRQVISHESIYRFIYAQLARKKEYSWRRYLPRAKFKRGYRGRRGGSPASFIAQRRPLSQRPLDAADRRSPGHWEADLMLFRTYGQVVLTLHERHSRLLIARRAPGKAADPIAQAMASILAPLRGPSGARVSPSTTAPSSPGITNSMPWASRPSSAMSAPPGRNPGGWRTPSAECAASCPARPTWPKYSKPLFIIPLLKFSPEIP